MLHGCKKCRDILKKHLLAEVKLQIWTDSGVSPANMQIKVEVAAKKVLLHNEF